MTVGQELVRDANVAAMREATTSNKGGTNRFAAYAGKMRRVLCRAFDADKVRSVLDMLYDRAVNSQDVTAGIHILDRVYGKPVQETRQDIGISIAINISDSSAPSRALIDLHATGPDSVGPALPVMDMPVLPVPPVTPV